MKLILKKLKDNAVIPVRATSGSAGLDLCSCIDSPVDILPGEIAVIPTGLSAQPESNDTALMIYPRSGLASRYGISLANCVGVVDSDYRGEICVPLINHGSERFTVENGMRIAQLVVTPVILPEIEVSDALSATERGCGGFGSTGL
ncbi:MAG: dUTP diphosphatase [Ruminococcus sp.]|nr:dUTP diphosphatase [Ruminococcus sp.]